MNTWPIHTCLHLNARTQPGHQTHMPSAMIHHHHSCVRMFVCGTLSVGFCIIYLISHGGASVRARQAQQDTNNLIIINFTHSRRTPQRAQAFVYTCACRIWARMFERVLSASVTRKGSASLWLRCCDDDECALLRLSSLCPLTLYSYTQREPADTDSFTFAGGTATPSPRARRRHNRHHHGNDNDTTTTTMCLCNDAESMAKRLSHLLLVSDTPSSSAARGERTRCALGSTRTHVQ